MNIFMNEVVTQGPILKECLQLYTNEQYENLKNVTKLYKKHKYNKIVLAGMGSSYYAANCISSYLISHGYPTFVYNAFDVSRKRFELIDEKTMLICISQSGKSWEAIELAQKASSKTEVIGMYNIPDSPLSKVCKHHLMINAGVETCISSKSYQNTLMVLNIFAHELTGNFNEAFREEALVAIDWCSDWLLHYKENTNPIYEFTKDSYVYDFVANDASLSTAQQAGLIYREGPKLTTCSWEFADYAHGWNKNAQNGYLGIYLVPTLNDETAETKMMDMVIQAKGKILLLTHTNVPSSDQRYVLTLPNIRDSLTPLMEIIVCDTLMGLILGEGWTR